MYGYKSYRPCIFLIPKYFMTCIKVRFILATNTFFYVVRDLSVKIFNPRI